MLKMKQRFRPGTVAATAAAVAALAAASPASGATTSTLGGIRLNTAPLPAVISTPAALDAFSNWRIGWGAGETVTATAPDESVTTLADHAAEAGSVAFSLRTAGNWTLSSSGGGTVSFEIASSAFVDVSSQPSGAFAMDTVGAGPNRAVKAGRNPPVAYSGDHWRRDASKAATLTFTPPPNSNRAATTLNFTGTGSTPFKLSGNGDWTVRLAMADGTALDAVVNVDAPLTLSFF